MSQFALSIMAETTPRYVSFIETGRSRPGREIVLRLAHALDLPFRERNSLLAAAGLGPEYAERDLSDQQSHPYRAAIDIILERHNPYPAAAVDVLGRVLVCNEAFNKFSPGMENLEPAESIDAFFAPGPMQKYIENWSELAWHWVDRQRIEVARTNNSELSELLARAERHLVGVKRPTNTSALGPDVIAPRFRVGDQIIATFVTIMRFESAREVTLSELRIELVFPLDAAGEAFFKGLPAS